MSMVKRKDDVFLLGVVLHNTFGVYCLSNVCVGYLSLSVVTEMAGIINQLKTEGCERLLDLVVRGMMAYKGGH